MDYGTMQERPRAYDVMAATCPSRTVLHSIGARWTLFVIVALNDGPMRFNQLKTRIQGITPKVLTETLRMLQTDGLVTRTEYAEQPPHVEYDLTDLGRSLQGPVQCLREWAEDHVPEIMQARERTQNHAGAVHHARVAA